MNSEGIWVTFRNMAGRNQQVQVQEIIDIDGKPFSQLAASPELGERLADTEGRLEQLEGMIQTIIHALFQEYRPLIPEDNQGKEVYPDTNLQKM